MTDGENNAGKDRPAHRRRGRQGPRREGLHHRRRHAGQGPHAASFSAGKRWATRWEPVDVDEETLKKIAGHDRGKYYRADNTQKFQAIYAEIDGLEKSEAEIKKFTQFRELFPWFISPGLGLLLVEVVLRHTLLRRLP